MAVLTTRERDLFNAYQRDFPLEPRPFRAVADKVGCSEADALGLVRGLLKRNLISRLGAVVRPNTAGASTLAAMAVPQERLEEVAAMVSAEEGVNHNYEREHEVNLWFVVTACDEAGVRRTLERIERKTGLAVIDLPLEQAYHIDLGFPL